MRNSIRRSLSEWFRRKRDGRLRELIIACPRRGETLEILDLGGRSEYWCRIGFDFLASQGVRITLLNLHRDEIVEDPDAPDGLLQWVVGDGRRLDFCDGMFDLCHSNSVIEHVGNWPDMGAFAYETRRVAASYYIQTPNYWFPVDPHFPSLPAIHWLPRSWRAWLMRRFPLAYAGTACDEAEAYRFVDSVRLLTKRQLRLLFPEGTIATERFLFLAKSFIATHIAVHNGVSIKQRNSHG